MATDNFDRPNANPAGEPWSTEPGCSAMKIENNQLSGTGNFNAAFYNALTFNKNQSSKAIIKSNILYVSVAVRMATGGATTNLYAFGPDDSTHVKFQKCVGGNWSQLGSAIACPIAINDGIEITANETTLEGFVNGVSQGTRTDSDISSGAAGVYIYGTNGAVDNWEGGNLGTSGTNISVFIEAETGTPWFPISTTMISRYSGRQVTFSTDPRIMFNVDNGEPYLVINAANVRFISKIKGGFC